MYKKLRVKYIRNGRWQLLEALSVPEFETVPAGFVTDLDSVPRVPIVHATFKGRAIVSAVIHDYLYHSGRTRSYADKAFLSAMEREGVRRCYRYPIYWAVRLFGRANYPRTS